MAGHLFVTPRLHSAETIVSHDSRVQSWLQSFSMQLARESLGVSIMGTVKSDSSAARNSLASLLGLCYTSTEPLPLSQYCKNPVLKQRNVSSYTAVQFTRFLRERGSVSDAPLSFPLLQFTVMFSPWASKNMYLQLLKCQTLAGKEPEQYHITPFPKSKLVVNPPSSLWSKNYSLVSGAKQHILPGLWCGFF